MVEAHTQVGCLGRSPLASHQASNEAHGSGWRGAPIYGSSSSKGPADLHRGCTASCLLAWEGGGAPTPGLQDSLPEEARVEINTETWKLEKDPQEIKGQAVLQGLHDSRTSG